MLGRGLTMLSSAGVLLNKVKMYIYFKLSYNYHILVV